MANTITAGNGTNNGLAVTSDATGALNILTGSGAGTAAISIDSSQNVTAAANLSVTGNATITGTLTPTGGVSGNLSVNGNSLVISGSSVTGYGTGSGGTVTQLTNKSTAVTLNKPTGQVTMNNAALAAGANASFLINNSLVSATDIAIVSASSNGNYRVEVASTNAGNIAVRVTNVTAGSLSEALVVNFAIIKGVTA